MGSEQRCDVIQIVFKEGLSGCSVENGWQSGKRGEDALIWPRDDVGLG